MHPGQGPGLSLHDLGETGGSQTVTLLESEIPSHSHAFAASNQDSTSQSPVQQNFAGGIGGISFFAEANAGSLTQLSDNALAPAGGDQPHNNMQPYLTLNFCIALQGVFPPRT
jgi:microcystin-dependent protein